MSQVHLEWTVVWSAPLIAIVSGAQLAVIAGVGVFAATPPVATAYLLYPGSTNNESAIVTIMPAATWGDRALDLGSPKPDGAYGVPAHCYPGSLWPGCSLVISIAGCLDHNCQKLGTFRVTTVASWEEPYSQVLVPPGITTFRLTVWYPIMNPLPVEMVWLDEFGLPIAFTPLSAFFTWALLAGLAMLVSAWALGRPSIPRWTREYLSVTSPKTLPRPRGEVPKR